MERPHVLLVDDNEATCTLVTALLQRDFSIDVATDGGEAIERLKTKRYAAVVLDLLMPQMDGFTVLDYLKENDPAVLRRVLVLTAALTRPTLDRVRAYPVCDVIAKPFEIETLLDAVRACAGSDGSLAHGLSSGVLLLLAEFIGRRLM